MKMATPLPTSAASAGDVGEAARRGRSRCRRSRPGRSRRARRCPAATGRAACAPGRGVAQRERLERRRAPRRRPSRARVAELADRHGAARRRAGGAAAGRAGPRSCRCPSRPGRPSERSALSSTVLPTPRRPVSTRERSGRPRATRSSTTSKACSCSSRPASSGGRWPAPGAYGLRTGSTIGGYTASLRENPRHPDSGRSVARGHRLDAPTHCSESASDSVERADMKERRSARSGVVMRNGAMRL